VLTPSSASAAPPVREPYQAAASEAEIQPEEPNVEVRLVEETVPFEEPVAVDAMPVATPISTEAPVIPTRNGEPELPITKPQEKSVPSKEEKASVQKTAAAAKQ